MLGNKIQSFHTNSHLDDNKEMRTALNTTKGNCYLCLSEKLEITSYKGDNVLNERSELINKCRQQNKFTLLRHDSKD